MLLASSDLRAVSAARRRAPGYTLLVGQALTTVLALAAVLALSTLAISRARTLYDDLRYGRPRVSHLDGFLGHGEARGVPSHLMALNLHRKIVLVEFPGGDTAKPKVLEGPYLFGAQSDQTPVGMQLRDMDRDGALDVVLDIDDEWLIYLNKDGGLRLPTDAEQQRIRQLNEPEGAANGT